MFSKKQRSRKQKQNDYLVWDLIYILFRTPSPSLPFMAPVVHFQGFKIDF